MSESATSVEELISDAQANTEAMPVERAKARRDDDLLFVDIRDVRERWRDGTVPGAEHVPRGMLEFWADPESEYHREFMDPERPILVFCAGGGARSALCAQTLQRLGFQNVAHLEGGFRGWADAGGETVDVPQEPYE